MAIQQRPGLQVCKVMGHATAADFESGRIGFEGLAVNHLADSLAVAAAAQHQIPTQICREIWDLEAKTQAIIKHLAVVGGLWAEKYKPEGGSQPKTTKQSRQQAKEYRNKI